MNIKREFLTLCKGVYAMLLMVFIVIMLGGSIVAVSGNFGQIAAWVSRVSLFWF